jgi:hypothetical protein
MWIQIGTIFGFICLLVGLVVLASKNGSKSAQLEALKLELKKRAEEQAREQRIIDYSYSLSADDARRRLHDVANKK